VLLVRVVPPWICTFTDLLAVTEVTCCWVTVRVVSRVVVFGSADDSDSVSVACATALEALAATVDAASAASPEPHAEKPSVAVNPASTAIAREATRGMAGRILRRRGARITPNG